MFQSLRQNSPIYILHKGNTPFMEVGTVTNVPVPEFKYKNSPIPPQYGSPQEMVVNLTVKINDRIVNYNSIPAQLDVADTYSNGENIVISDSRDAMNSEVFSYKQRSIDIINSVDQHKAIIAGCDNILNDLNPEYAEKQQQQAELSQLKNQVADMAKNMQLLIEKLNRKETKDEQNVGNKGA